MSIWAPHVQLPDTWDAPFAMAGVGPAFGPMAVASEAMLTSMRASLANEVCPYEQLLQGRPKPSAMPISPIACKHVLMRRPSCMVWFHGHDECRECGHPCLCILLSMPMHGLHVPMHLHACSPCNRCCAASSGEEPLPPAPARQLLLPALLGRPAGTQLESGGSC